MFGRSSGDEEDNLSDNGVSVAELSDEDQENAHSARNVQVSKF